MIRAIVFDVDGVLIDSEPIYLDIKMAWLAQFGLSVTREQMTAYAGERLSLALRSIFPGLTPERCGEITDGFAQSTAVTCLEYERILNPRARELLSSLKRDGYRMALASSSGVKKLEIFLESCDLGSYFEFVLNGDMFERMKPDPAIYTRAAELFGLPPSECAAVEDSDQGLAAAYNASFYVICKRDDRFHYKQTQAHAWIDDLSEVLDVLRKTR